MSQEVQYYLRESIMEQNVCHPFHVQAWLSSNGWLCPF